MLIPTNIHLLSRGLGRKAAFPYPVETAPALGIIFAA